MSVFVCSREGTELEIWLFSSGLTFRLELAEKERRGNTFLWEFMKAKRVVISSTILLEIFRHEISHYEIKERTF